MRLNLLRTFGKGFIFIVNNEKVIIHDYDTDMLVFFSLSVNISTTRYSSALNHKILELITGLLKFSITI